MNRMSDDAETLPPLPEQPGLDLSPQQRAVLDALRIHQDERFPLGDWYVGALRVLRDPLNPERIAQAANSLREIVEKLYRVIPRVGVVASNYDHTSRRRDIHDRFQDDQHRYSDDWRGKTIDPELAKTLDWAAAYFEQSQQPSRRQQQAMAISAFDPLDDRLVVSASTARREALLTLNNALNSFAHHQKSDADEFLLRLQEFEDLLFSLLAPITADDQNEMLEILERFDGDEADINRVFALMERRGANTGFFFERASDPAWMPILNSRGYFSHQPLMENLGDGLTLHPAWPPMSYLLKVGNVVPDQVLEVIESFPKVENRTVYGGILAIARAMPGAYSARLLSRILDHPQMEPSSILIQFPHVAAHWASENEADAALGLVKVMLDQLPPMPTVGPTDWHSAWSYAYAIEHGAVPLLAADAYGTAILLADALAEALAAQGLHPDEDPEAAEDLSELWQYRLDEPVQGTEQPRNALVLALALAGRTVFDSQPDQVAELDQRLRGHPWAVFRRIRQYLYGLHPAEKTKPWIRQMVLSHQGYERRDYLYEFQLMVRRACEHFGPAFLTADDLGQIFDAIMAGPPRQGFHGDDLEFGQLQSVFHRKQLRPFAAVLFGRYWDYFQQLDNKNEHRLSDDDYYGRLRRVQLSAVTSASPRSAQALAQLADQDLLAYINRWEDEHELRAEGITQINIGALAKHFGEVFANSIAISDGRHRFWMDNLASVERPIYVREIINSAKTLLETAMADRIRDWLSVCEWVLTHPDEPRDNVPWSADKSKDNPYWGDARRAVGDFVDACVRTDTFAVSECTGQIDTVLQALCTQYDWHLDEDRLLYGGRERWLDEAVNATRSKALHSLVTLGLRLKQNDPDADISAVMETLDLRIGTPERWPITRPELAMLALHYRNLLFLDEQWATAHKGRLFPQQDPGDWLASFGTFLASNDPHEQAYEIFADDYEMALEALPALVREAQTYKDTDIVDALGQHLLMYHIWGLHEVRDENTLLTRYYRGTEQDKERWAVLFNFLGNSLHSEEGTLNDELEERVKAFFEWRLRVADPTEIGRFSWWLRADCLEAVWRLDAFLRVLDLNVVDTVFLSWEVLESMAGTHTAKVLHCLEKMVADVAPSGFDFHLGWESAANIIRTAMRSTDPAILQRAGLIREGLLQKGRSEFLEVSA